MLDVINNKWPASAAGSSSSYDDARSVADDYLKSIDVITTGFGHYGVVVTDMDEARAWLTETVDDGWAETKTVWGSAFGCHVASRIRNDIEIELIQPVEQSFFLNGLQKNGPGLHHAAFYVGDIDSTVENLRNANADFLDPTIRNGVHGRIIFVSSSVIQPLAIEICEPYADGH